VVPPRPNLVDSAFFVTILIKGLGGLVELLTGILLIFISLHTLQHDLAPAGRLGLLPKITGGARLFAIIYFCLRGSIRMFLALALLSERLWAYPVSLVLLGASVGYQLWLLASGHFSVGLAALTTLDSVTAALTWYEYKNLRRGGHLRLRPHLPASPT
jgi:uncharacterized membrane protein